MTATAPLTMEVAPGIEAILPRLSCELPDGRIGHFQRRIDDCLRAAIATVVDCSYESVPDCIAPPGTAADELAAWEELWQWALLRGLRLRFHSGRPDGDTFIGIGPPDENRYRHTVAVVGGHLFDPGSGWKLPAGYRQEPTRKIEFAISFPTRKDRA